MNGTDLDGCFEAASIPSSTALIEAEGSVSDNKPCGSGNPFELEILIK